MTVRQQVEEVHSDFRNRVKVMLGRVVLWLALAAAVTSNIGGAGKAAAEPPVPDQPTKVGCPFGQLRYTVARNDGLDLIAATHGISVLDLLRVNINLRRMQILHVGQLICIPAARGSVSASHPVSTASPAVQLPSSGPSSPTLAHHHGWRVVVAVLGTAAATFAALSIGWFFWVRSRRRRRPTSATARTDETPLGQLPESPADGGTPVPDIADAIVFEVEDPSGSVENDSCASDWRPEDEVTSPDLGPAEIDNALPAVVLLDQLPETVSACGSVVAHSLLNPDGLIEIDGYLIVRAVVMSDSVVSPGMSVSVDWPKSP